MSLSKHNIIVPIADSSEFFITNPLYKTGDIISAAELQELQQEHDPSGEYAKHVYLVDEEKEKKAFKFAYLDFQEKREEDEVQLFFVPNYSCNFACSYCYQEGYEPVKQVLSTEIIDAFFNYIHQEFAGRKKYITVFGGEPLMPGEKQRNLIDHLLNKSKAANLEIGRASCRGTV